MKQLIHTYAGVTETSAAHPVLVILLIAFQIAAITKNKSTPVTGAGNLLYLEIRSNSPANSLYLTF
jgi:hypothetical protein